MRGFLDAILSQLSRTRMAVIQHTPKINIGEFIKIGVIPLLVAVGGTWATNRVQNRDSLELKNRSAFVEEARTFDFLVANYVRKILDNKQADSDAAQQIVANIIRQNNLIDEITPQLSSRDRHLVVEYKRLLSTFYDLVPQSDSVLHMQAFWEDASKVLVARNELITKLEN